MPPSCDPYQDYGYRNAGPNCSHAYLWPALRALVTQHLPASPAAGGAPRAIDIGCGNGWVCGRLATLGLAVSGYDASTEGIGQARRVLPAGRFEVLAVGAEPRAVFGDGWDLVVSTEVIEHLYAPRRLLLDARALLRPGGLLVLSTPYHGYLKNLTLALGGRMDRHFTALWDGGHIKFFSRRTLTALLLEAGFEPLGFRGAGRAPWLWRSMVLAARKPMAPGLG